MDYQATLYNPVFTVLGVDARLYTVASNVWHNVRALDKTAGTDVGDRGAEKQVIKPAVKLRMAELQLHGIELDEFNSGALIQINGFQYQIESYKLDPSPKGQRDGVVLLLVIEDGPVVEDSESESESDG